MTDWYALRVPPQKEKLAVQILHRRGISAFAPVEVKHFRRKGHKKRVEKEYVILNRYILMPVEGIPAWHVIFSLNIIQSVVGDSHPAKIHPRQIENIFRIASEKVPTRNLNKGFKEGDAAVMTYGALVNQVVRVEKVVGYRAHALLTTPDGKEIKITAPLDQLEAA